jgi:hypothetical protein
MKLTKIISSSFLLLGLKLLGLQAQQVIPASGGNASGSGGTASYTVGQVLYTTNIGSKGSVVQGVQQTYEISVISGVENAKDINLSYIVFPNPTADYLTLKINSNSQIRFVASLYDINGRLISMQGIESNESRIEMKNLVSGVYFLKVYNTIGLIKTFKIIKN